MSRRDYGTGSVYQTAEGRWRGAIAAGWNANGTRRRVTASGKTEAIVKRRLRDKARALERGEEIAGRVTVKAWAEDYLTMRVHDLRPKAYRAAESPIRKWIIPTIGHKRLDQLTPGDIRAVDDAQRKAGVQPHATRRVLVTMLNWAIREGHTVPPRVLKVPLTKAPKSDRQGMTLEEGVALIEQAAKLPHGTRWLMTLIYGQRQGECLGLTWGAVDFELGDVAIEWQLQALPYNIRRDRKSGFRVPDDHEARHLVDAYHLVRPKSQQGLRVVPMLPALHEGLLAWRDTAPANSWGLIWPEPNGRPRNDKHDREEWWALQKAADVRHPSGRPYHIHETRNFAATMLLLADVDEHIITSLLGHSSIVTSRRYMSVWRESKREAMGRVGELLRLG